MYLYNKQDPDMLCIVPYSAVSMYKFQLAMDSLCEYVNCGSNIWNIASRNIVHLSGKGCWAHLMLKLWQRKWRKLVNNSVVDIYAGNNAVLKSMNYNS